MNLKKKEIQLKHKAAFEAELKDRLAYLAGKGVKAPQSDKDPILRRIQADLRAVGRRLRAVEAQEKLAANLAQAKVDKAEALKKEKEGGKQGGKGEGKAEKPKKAAGDQPAKEKKPKPEKKPAAPKAPEGGEPPTPAAA